MRVNCDNCRRGYGIVKNFQRPLPVQAVMEWVPAQRKSVIRPLLKCMPLLLTNQITKDTSYIFCLHAIFGLHPYYTLASPSQILSTLVWVPSSRFLRYVLVLVRYGTGTSTWRRYRTTRLPVRVPADHISFRMRIVNLLSTAIKPLYCILSLRLRIWLWRQDYPFSFSCSWQRRQG